MMPIDVVPYFVNCVCADLTYTNEMSIDISPVQIKVQFTHTRMNLHQVC